jgi:hypothetical protein
MSMHCWSVSRSPDLVVPADAVEVPAVATPDVAAGGVVMVGRERVVV